LNKKVAAPGLESRD